MSTALACLAFLAYWSLGRVLLGGCAYCLPVAALALLGISAGIPYLGWFLRKTRSLA